jgi:hypothetical protein
MIDPMPNLVRAVYAFDAARKRLEAAVPDRDEAFAPLAEACWWAVCVHEGLRTHGGVDYDSGWPDFAGGQIVRGLVYARNMIGHQRVTSVQQLSEAREVPEFWSLVQVQELRWLDADDLPDPDRSQPENRKAYADFVAGREVTGTLLLAASWLFHSCGILGFRLDDEEADDDEAPAE